jgi:hypothetical protein
MPRFNRSLTLWTFALLVASVLLAWPLHEARHASQAAAELVGASSASSASADGVTATVVGASVDVDAALIANAFAFDDHSEADGLDGGNGEVKGGGCAWCLFHAQLFAASDTPLAFSFHAEASPPPLAPTCGLPTGRCVLAAHPRGPPRA